MGSVWVKGQEVIEYMSEFVGFKLGLTVSAEQLAQAVRTHGALELWPDDLEVTYRYRSEAMEYLGHTLLTAFGDPDAADVRDSPLAIAPLLKEFADFGDLDEALKFVMNGLPELPLNDQGDALDPAPLLEEVSRRWGVDGVAVALRLMGTVNARLTSNLWTRVRRTEHSSRVDLRDLFDSESLPLPLGVFIDQRFIDYLDANTKELACMHWRQFEGLVAEKLRREGLKVGLGPGRADEGVDVRAWDPDAPADAPAVLLVQCKRTRQKIERVVVKALAADVIFEGARRGMVATTSAWSPGARSTVDARSYPVDEANQDTLIEWLAQMRTPGAGLWLPEGIRQVPRV
ncbi:restriction endonuclease [Kitasatospora sp. NPDC088779]|uniref:restriction endonuclease n=1 Tax=unclassified Kitasatospora TaxID=2633591 RepID=UPI0034335A55